MSLIADKKVVNYYPTKDDKRDPNKKYYYFDWANHTDGEVSRSYMAKEYTGEVFYPYTINEVTYRV
jgi:hypothetical protein